MQNQYTESSSETQSPRVAHPPSDPPVDPPVLGAWPGGPRCPTCGLPQVGEFAPDLHAALQALVNAAVSIAHARAVLEAVLR